MADGIVKSVRVRAVNTNIDERHSGLGDIEVRVIHDGGKNYKVGWIPKGGYGISYDFKKKGKYELYTPDNFIAAVMYQQSRHEKNLNASIVDVDDFNQDYYEIIQDPWVEGDVPLKRSFGKDPYYLNNQTKVSIFWFIGDKQSITKKAFYNLDLRFDQEGSWVGGVGWSDEFGREETNIDKVLNVIVKDGEVSRYVKSNIVKYVLISNEESGEKFTVDTFITEFISSFSSTPNADSAHQWGSAIASSVTDEQILSKIIEVWKKEVTDYDDLGVCYKKAHPDKYLPKHFSCNEIVYKSPISPPPEEPEPTPTEESVQTQGTPKIKLSVVLPEELELKVKEDLNEVKVYIGDPPLEEEGAFIFQDDFDNLEELDPEFMESDFAGDEELIMKEPDEEFRQEIEKAGDDAENNPVSGDALPNSWFNYSTKKFGQPDVDKTYSSEYKPQIDPSKMPSPKMTKASLIAVKLKVEGGLTGDPADSAAKDNGFCPTKHSDGKKYHTNKGITYKVWKTVFGTGNDKRFLVMNHNDWVKIFDSKYWDKHGNSSKYESVNTLLVSYAWGGNKDATIRGAKTILGITSTALGSSLDIVSEAEAVAALISARAQFFINISQPGNKNNRFRKGWINATNAFVEKMYVNALA